MERSVRNRVCGVAPADVEGAMRGRIASVSPDGSFGYITPDDEGGEIVFHRHALHGSAFDELEPGVAVELRLGQEAGDRPSDGLRAVDVRLARNTVPAVNRETPPPL
jgi:cold shock CspA family protein